MKRVFCGRENVSKQIPAYLTIISSLFKSKIANPKCAEITIYPLEITFNICPSTVIPNQCMQIESKAKGQGINIYGYYTEQG